MERRSFSSVTDQFAETLLDGIRQGHWADELPGRVALARETFLSGSRQGRPP